MSFTPLLRFFYMKTRPNLKIFNAMTCFQKCCHRWTLQICYVVDVSSVLYFRFWNYDRFRKSQKILFNCIFFKTELYPSSLAWNLGVRLCDLLLPFRILTVRKRPTGTMARVKSLEKDLWDFWKRPSALVKSL